MNVYPLMNDVSGACAASPSLTNTEVRVPAISNVTVWVIPPVPPEQA